MKTPAVFVDGQFVAEDEAKVSVFDRAFLYGDGLFETVRVSQGAPFRLHDHLARLRRGAEFLRIGLSPTDGELAETAIELIGRNGIEEGIVRVNLSRGVGPAGYSIQGALRPFLVMSTRSIPAVDPMEPVGWRVATSSLRLAQGDGLARFKTCSKLAQVWARAEAEALGADEALLMNSDGDVAEAASGNLFWIEAGGVFTPGIGSPALEGITRAVIIQLCGVLGIACGEGQCARAALKKSEGAFITLSSLGVVEITSLDDQPMRRSPLTRTIHRAYQALLRSETRSSGP